jgi:hypothetical protein
VLIRTPFAVVERDRHRYDALSLNAVPFGPGDVTAGSEDELQAVVTGSSEACDLPLAIRESRFFHNIARRTLSGEAPRHTYAGVQEFLDDSSGVWENSWIRFPERKLSPHALAVFHADLASAGRPNSRRTRNDASRYTCEAGAERLIRVPISYALKLALADFVGTQPHLPESMRLEAERLMGHFSNDNTSPETVSFHVSGPRTDRTIGEQVAQESARRFLFTSLLMAYANRRFALIERGQRGMVYHAPHPPVRQTELSSCISDSFYRELFMSPCLSGWDDGEAKTDYMHLCHQALSRSQLNSVAKLREAGIIANNLIVLPSLSNVSLANNGTHISIGSPRLTKAMAELDPATGLMEEKCLGDLAIKIFEHFLPLFVGTYSAAPYRIDFAQFHPERLLAFLPHELDFTHLRLMWREWKEKAQLRVLGHPVTPYGPPALDRLMATVFNMRGDQVPDYRLINYPVAWLATEHQSALDGTPGNTGRLAAELEQLGVVDRRMSFYMPLRLREFGQHGYSGFEGRYYSLFPGYAEHQVQAADLQHLLLHVAYQFVIEESVAPWDIPDDPTSESERRQPFFFAAAGLSAFYVHKNSRNQFLRNILKHCTKTRSSWRHPEYFRVSLRDYRNALLAFLQHEAPDAIESLAAGPLLEQLRERLLDPQLQASQKLSAGILASTGERNAMRLTANEFNRAAERYYRDELRLSHISEAYQYLRQDVVTAHHQERSDLRSIIRRDIRVQDPLRFLESIKSRLLRDDLTAIEIATLLNLLLVLTRHDQRTQQMGNP